MFQRLIAIVNPGCCQAFLQSKCGVEFFCFYITNMAKYSSYAWFWALSIIDNPGHDIPSYLSCLILCLLLFWKSSLLYLPYPGCGEVAECREDEMPYCSLCMGNILFIKYSTNICCSFISSRMSMLNTTYFNMSSNNQ